jgi:hypothetical protein
MIKQGRGGRVGEFEDGQIGYRRLKSNLKVLGPEFAASESVEESETKLKVERREGVVGHKSRDRTADLFFNILHSIAPLTIAHVAAKEVEQSWVSTSPCRA